MRAPRLLRRIGERFVDYLSRPIEGFAAPVAYSAEQLTAVLQPGDVLLVEGQLRISTLIKFFTQSVWSHVALYVGPQPGGDPADPPCLVEAGIGEGVVLSPLSRYADSNTRICRAIGLRGEDRERIVAHALARVGHQYDLKNVIDLARLRLSRSFLAKRAKRGLAALGSGEPTRAICSSLIAQAFQSVGYPILPATRRELCRAAEREHRDACAAPGWEPRHFSLFAPGDFDVSPYFAVVKPPPAAGFDYTRLGWTS
jgi:hypothetical protein